MPHDTRGKYRRVTVDFLADEYAQLRDHLDKLEKTHLGQNEFIRAAVKFAILAGLKEVVPSPRPYRPY